MIMPRRMAVLRCAGWETAHPLHVRRVSVAGRRGPRHRKGRFSSAIRRHVHLAAAAAAAAAFVGNALHLLAQQLARQRQRPLQRHDLQ